MKTKILGLLAVVLLAGPMASNAAIYAVDQAVFTTVGVPVDGVLSATDLAGDALPYTFSIVQPPIYGDVVLNGVDTRFFTYTPPSTAPYLLAWPDNSFFFFIDAFFFRAFDGTSYSNDGTVIIYVRDDPTVPEPGTLALLGLGLAGLGLSRRRKAN